LLCLGVAREVEGNDLRGLDQEVRAWLLLAASLQLGLAQFWTPWERVAPISPGARVAKGQNVEEFAAGSARDGPAHFPRSKARLCYQAVIARVLQQQVKHLRASRG